MNAIQPIFQEILNRVCPPRFPVTYCSSCGEEFGPGEHGYSHCSDHGANNAELKARTYGGLVYISPQHAREAHARDDRALAMQIKASPDQWI